ncbi:hypothetical protein M3Y95_00360100 [Aphelenchoides besseyi]|nr:hypothetical protein M3Y95_00360100 [Aphelenchoides besseyi]
MFKRFNIGAVLMLLFVVLTTMFVAAEPTSCWKANTLEGSCSVNVTTNASSIKATMEIKSGSGDFKGSISIGSCTIPGTFYANSQTFVPDRNGAGSYRSPIKIEASPTSVTLQEGTRNPEEFCKSSFDVHDGLVRTTITLKLDSGNIVSLKLDDSVKIDKDDQPSENQFPVWGIVLICLGVSALFIVIVVIIVVVWCCCYRKKKQPVAVSEFKIPDQFEWPSDRFTAEQLDQLLVLFPVLELSHFEMDTRVITFLKKHPIKTKEQWNCIEKEIETYTIFVNAHVTKSGTGEPTREFKIRDILIEIRYFAFMIRKIEVGKNQKMEKTKVTLKQEGPIEKKEVLLEAKKEDQLGTKKEGGLIEKKDNQPEKKEAPKK